MKGKKQNTPTNASASSTADKAFKRAMNEETYKWINELLAQFDTTMDEVINGPNGIEFSRKYVLAEIRGFTLSDHCCMGAHVDAGLCTPYFGHVIPYMGMSHYPKSDINRILAEKLDEVVVKYIEFKGFKLGISDGNPDKVQNGEIVIHK